MNYFKICLYPLLLQLTIIPTAGAQIKSETQTAGVVFNGSRSFNDIKVYDKAHPELNNKKLPEAESEEDGEENTYELNKRVSGITKETFIKTAGIPRVNALKTISPNAAAAVNYCVQFDALTTNYNSYPPDVHGAVGFDHLITTLNTQVRIQTKTSDIVSTVSLTSFWSATGKADVFDPRIIYDQLSNRWISMACASRRSAGSSIVLAASQTPDPTGSWNFYTIDTDPADTLWFDYGSMGFSNDKIVIGGNMFNNIDGRGGDGGRLFTINKANVLNGAAIGTVTRTRGIAFTPCPALSFDNVGACYVLATWNGSVAQLKLYTITGTAASPTVTDNGVVDYGSGNGWAASVGNGLPQSGSAIKINSGDDRMQSAVYRNGKMFWANNFCWPAAAPTYCGIQYGSFTVSTKATLNFAGIWNPAGTEMFCFPNIAVNALEDVGVAFSYFSTSTFPSAAVAYGTNNLTLSYNIVKAGEAPYTYGFPADSTIRYRWGDYMSISVDPTDDKGMWSNSQYSRAPGNSNWGTWWAKLCPSSCPASFNLFFSVAAGTVKKYEVTNTITSTANISSGAFVKYDAGVGVTMSPGFVATAGSAFRAYIEGCGGNQ
ncbi:MAG: 3-coathanger stack domain-containing protein [Chitinophagaceae bacterium]